MSGVVNPVNSAHSSAPGRDDRPADGRFPHLAGWLARPTGPSPDEQFGLGLAFLLDGIESRVTARKSSPEPP